MWELDNPRVVALINNIIKCVETEEEISEDQKLTFINIVLSNLIIFGKYKIQQNACFINDFVLLYLIQSQTTNHPGGISMPIGFVRSEEEEDTWIAMLVKHILHCKDISCARCADAALYQYWTYID